MSENMSVNELMREKLQAVKSILIELNEQHRDTKGFDSHDFIRAFSRKFQSEYVLLLYRYYQNDPFLTVHAQIGRFLLDNQAELGISAQGKVSSPNIFGLNTENERWKLNDL
jgi:hypothetical protein